jgi:predicted amidohydrolase
MIEQVFANVKRGGTIRIATAAVPGCDEVPTRANVERATQLVRSAMQEAAARGARLVVFHEGALSYPHKRKISERPDEVGPADWGRADWSAIEQQLRQVCDWANDLSIWTVIHAPHRLTEPNRPHNSLYVIDDEGTVVDRYDKRYLSDTELRWLYTPGTRPVTFDVDGYRFGCALCIEVAIPDVFTEYAALGVDSVLFATSGVNDANLLHLRAHASLNGIWIAVANQWHDDGDHRIGVIDPNGTWAQGSTDRATAPAVVVHELDRDDAALAGAHFGRHWRIAARRGDLYADLRRKDDPRSIDTTTI